MEIQAIPYTAEQVAGGRTDDGRPRDGFGQRAGKPFAATPSTRELSQALLGDDGRVDLARPNELRLRVDDELQRVIATVVDSETGEVVREIPPEEIIAAAKKLSAMLGQILDRNV